MIYKLWSEDYPGKEMYFFNLKNALDMKLKKMYPMLWTVESIDTEDEYE